MPEQRPRPEVTLTGSSSPSAATEPPSPPRRRPVWLLLLLPLGLLVLALTRPADAPAPGPPAAAPPELVLTDQVTVSQGGVVVVTVELRNPGPELRVRSAAAYSEPVVQDPVVQAPKAVPAGGQRRVVALVAPDCRLLQPGSPLRFNASLLLVVGRGSERVDLGLDLTPAVTEVVAGLCRRG